MNDLAIRARQASGDVQSNLERERVAETTERAVLSATEVPAQADITTTVLLVLPNDSELISATSLSALEATRPIPALGVER